MKTSNDKPAIRRANLQDANAIKQCIDRAYSPVKERLNDLPDVSAGVEKEISQKVVFVAENNNFVAGCLILTFRRPMHIWSISRLTLSITGAGLRAC